MHTYIRFTRTGLSHGREATQLQEEAIRLLRMCREMRRKSPTELQDVLSMALDNSLYLLDDFQDEDDLFTVLDPPPIARKSKHFSYMRDLKFLLQCIMRGITLGADVIGKSS